ncbi:putative RNA-directed DNA polymerase from transposon X-element [Trichonephila clavipes]|nr:putative RNA-directed DNA polymerase from transposon X-element [Trichonephila clavipes]
MKNAAGRIKVDLSELYDLFESTLMALESLGRTKEKFAEFLEPLVESYLPETVLRAWERSRSVEDSSPQDSVRSLEAKEHDIELLLGADVIGNILTDAIGITDPTEDAKRKYAHSDFLNQFKENLSVLSDGRLRLYPIGLSSDIEKAFLQLSIIPEHRDYLRFFLPTVKETKIYRHCRVVFGICSSPFLLSACIDHLLQNSPARFDDVTQKLKHSFYVDNCVTRVSDIQQQENFIVKAIENKNKKDLLSELRQGEIVLIGDDIKKRMHWPLAKVIRLIPGKDGKIRTVQQKTRTGTMVRPIQRVYPLEAQSTETPDDPLNARFYIY